MKYSPIRLITHTRYSRSIPINLRARSLSSNSFNHSFTRTRTITKTYSSMPSSPIPLNHIVITAPLDDLCLAKIDEAFKDGTVTYCPDGVVPDEVLGRVDIMFNRWTGPPQSITSFPLQTPNLRHVQLTSAGSDKVQRHPAFLEQSSWLALACPSSTSSSSTVGPATKTTKETINTTDKNNENRKDEPPRPRHVVTLANASGTHVLSIPPWVVANVIILYHRLDQMIVAARNEQKWRIDHGFQEGEYVARTVMGKTVGMLGYGHLGRECARLLSAFGVTIIAANSSGKATYDNGYLIPGTGDLEGTLPQKYYSTKDPQQFGEFLRRSDILVCSLPSTKDTRMMLTKEMMGKLPKEAVIVNVGRGDLFSSDDLLEHLNNGHLWGAALDVTDPEPLPDFHPLWTHPKVIVTPHLSGNTEREFETAADVMLENVKRMREGKEVFNLVDSTRGY